MSTKKKEDIAVGIIATLMAVAGIALVAGSMLGIAHAAPPRVPPAAFAREDGIAVKDTVVTVMNPEGTTAAYVRGDGSDIGNTYLYFGDACVMGERSTFSPIGRDIGGLDAGRTWDRVLVQLSEHEDPSRERLRTAGILFLCRRGTLFWLDWSAYLSSVSARKHATVRKEAERQALISEKEAVLRLLREERERVRHILEEVPLPKKTVK